MDILTYHDQPPYIIDRKSEKGLSYEVINAVNNTMNTSYHIRILPKMRLKKMLTGKQGAVMIWAVSLTFGGIENAKQHGFIWGKALLYDQQGFISRINKPVEYMGPTSLYGLALGGVQGHTYFGLQDDIDSGKIIRINSSKEAKNIRLLLAQRLDVITMAHSSAKYYENLFQVGNKLYFSKQPLNRYSRHFLASKNQSSHIDRVNHWLHHAVQNGSYKKLLAKYGLDTLIPPR
ncbi:transporter substrate-binding domain-containing protein [Endozoicomonas sp. SM1973]|uniref:Transporter substrate-binding domain-containing protein n=1 Tax=Spartinivicinus marinus TaxID=2994442 RepID=A0A853I4Q5_9GAMM|nr:transporter substrate-binding domain-containing protein [Spartinivicinus marinus]MCX4029550.1 transporter substrate-binding domain-containing protein [Spartinivicinus marinus]NYZ65124.1 transporter substrate-binding domain-containing protein [Spartinivicinus marinus]